MENPDSGIDTAVKMSTGIVFRLEGVWIGKIMEAKKYFIGGNKRECGEKGVLLLI